MAVVAADRRAAPRRGGGPPICWRRFSRNVPFSPARSAAELRARAAQAAGATRSSWGSAPISWDEAEYPPLLVGDRRSADRVCGSRGRLDVLRAPGRRDRRIARRFAVRARGRGAACRAIWPRAASSSSAAWRAASIPPRTAARSARGGSTIGVLGSGADVIYPPRAPRRSRARCAGAARSLSELVPGTPPLAHFFPLRNRIISGLSRAVVVIEAGEKSGSLITARLALEQGREVLAVPGNVLSGRNRGGHALLRDGAKIVETADDILEELGLPARLRAGTAAGAGRCRRRHGDPFWRGCRPANRAIWTRLPSESGVPIDRVAAAAVRARIAGDRPPRRRRPIRPDLTDRARVKKETVKGRYWLKHWSWSNRRRRRRPSTNISGATTRSSRRWGTSAICRRASWAWTSTTTSRRSTNRIGSRKKVIKELKDAAKDATDIYVATDPDREGEAIGWHLDPGARREEAEDPPPDVQRDHEEGGPGRAEAPAGDRREDGRRAAGAPRARSAGRLQDQPAALGQGAPRPERRPRAVGGAEARLRPRDARSRRSSPRSTGTSSRGWPARSRRSSRPSCSRRRRRRIKVANEEQSKGVLADLEGAAWVVASVTTKERKRNAPPPFITSKLQQTARFPVKKTMMLAQQLYEGASSSRASASTAVGLITYMRTDSVRVADEALAAVRELHQDGVRRRVPAGEAERLQDEVRRAGRARSDPADVAAVRSRKRCGRTSRPISTRSTG